MEPDPAVKAFIDIGTNSVRMVLVRFRADGGFTELAQRKETVRLGEGEFDSGLLQPAAMARASLVVAGFAQMARAAGAAEIVAIATSATREARNRLAFLQRIHDEAGVVVHPISGPEEARLIFLGVASGLDLADREALVIDIGGGSTEMIVGSGGGHRAVESVKLGAIRLTNAFEARLGDAPVAPELYAAMRRVARGTAIRAVQALRAHLPVDVAIGSSGTAENLADIAARLTYGRPRQPSDGLTLAQLRAVAALLCRLPLAERRRVAGLNPARADIIVAGAAILETLLDELGVGAITISDRGLREGLIVDDIDRRHPPRLRGLTVREQSVLQLGRRCQFDEAHHTHVARLALGLFDSARDAGLHDLGARPREILQHAAMLHDIGAFLSYSGHEQHTYYLIRHAPLLGFDSDEIALIAAVARFHRKGFPSKARPEYLALPPSARRQARPLAMLLRLAESLDRTHSAPVAAARLARRPDGDGLRLEIAARADWQLERWGVESQLDAFARTFGERAAVVETAVDA